MLTSTQRYYIELALRQRLQECMSNSSQEHFDMIVAASLSHGAHNVSLATLLLAIELAANKELALEAPDVAIDG